jgi:tetratricopeptide (TPR) repeat protein
MGLLLFVLPGLVLAVLYAPALDYDFVWTDTSAIAGRSMLRPEGEIGQAFREPLHRIEHRGDAAHQAYYRPLQVVLLSWVDARAGSLPRHFRAAGFAIGALCLGVFALFAWQLLGSAVAALLAALFVACHPVGIECYVWIAGVSGPLSAALACAAIALALAAASARSRAGFAGLGLASLAMLLAALLSKERALVTPALFAATWLAASRLAPERGRRPDPMRAAALVIAQLGLALAYWLVWRPRVLGTSAPPLPPIDGSYVTQLLSAVANWPAKLAWLFLPWQSSTSDVIRVVEHAGDAGFWLGIGLALASAAAAFVCLRGGRPICALGIAWIWIAYLPTAGLLPMLHANGERYWFLSAFGAALIVADLVGVLARRTGPVPATVVALALLAFLAQRTHARLPTWESNLGLIEHEIARDPAFREGYFLVAFEQFQRGRLDEADRALATLLAEGPEFVGTASYWNPLSVSELACGVAFARKDYDRVLELEHELGRRHPGALRAAPLRICIGRARIALGDPAAALAAFESVERELGASAPPGLYLMLARAELLLGHAAPARSWLARARATAGPDRALLTKIVQLERSLPQEPIPAGSRP